MTSTQRLPVRSLLFQEIPLEPIEIELHTRFQIPSFQILGLPGPEVQEARERIVAAFHAQNIEFPKKRVMVNLAPVSKRKTGTGHDLGIAYSILRESIDLPERADLPIYAWGELSLTGQIKPAHFIPRWIEFFLDHNPALLFLGPDDSIHWNQLMDWRRKMNLKTPDQIQIEVIHELMDFFQINSNPSKDFGANSVTSSMIKKNYSPAQVPAPLPALLPLNPRLMRTLQIAIAGEHHLLIVGPKGVGKSQSLEWIRQLSPKIETRFQWQAWLAGAEIDPHNQDRPFRRVHAQIRPAHLLGSWTQRGLVPGELVKAHGGILVADEFLEWPRDSKECLREPLEENAYSLVRVHGAVKLDCEFQFVGTGNLCPCGGLPAAFARFIPKSEDFYGQNTCRCHPHDVQNYWGRLSGPVADRIDLTFIQVSEPGKVDSKSCDAPELLAGPIADARNFSLERWGCPSARIEARDLTGVESKFSDLLKPIRSLRGRHKVLRVAHTLQALEQADQLSRVHVLEALSYRVEVDSF